MDEVLQKAIEGLLNTVNQAGDFVIEQAPEVIQQWILYTIVSNTVASIIAVSLLILGYLFTFKWVDQRPDTGYNEGSWRESKCGAATVSVGVGIGSCIVLYYSISTLLLVTLAPKVFILQEASYLVR